VGDWPAAVAVTRPAAGEAVSVVVGALPATTVAASPASGEQVNAVVAPLAAAVAAALPAGAFVAAAVPVLRTIVLEICPIGVVCE
jgi:hypothetical protein